MWFEKHPYLFIYISGYVCVILLMIFQVVWFSILNWITKNNTLKKNLKKLSEPPQLSFSFRTAAVLGACLLEALMSWFDVIIILYHIVKESLQIFRESFSSVPEEIKLLRFPLKNNPDLSRESVWAYVIALEVKSGENTPDSFRFMELLEEVKDTFKSFDPSVALKQLKSLNVVDPEIISKTLKLIEHNEHNQDLDDNDDWFDDNNDEPASENCIYCGVHANCSVTAGDSILQQYPVCKKHKLKAKLSFKLAQSSLVSLFLGVLSIIAILFIPQDFSSRIANIQQANAFGQTLEILIIYGFPITYWFLFFWAKKNSPISTIQNLDKI